MLCKYHCHTNEKNVKIFKNLSQDILSEGKGSREYCISGPVILGIFLSNKCKAPWPRSSQGSFHVTRCHALFGLSSETRVWWQTTPFSQRSNGFFGIFVCLVGNFFKKVFGEEQIKVINNYKRRVFCMIPRFHSLIRYFIS